MFLNESENGTDEEKVIQLKFIVYGVLVPTLATFGICGNILNLVTLCSATLQTVPFMYIRAIAIFDLICLILVELTTDRFKRINAEYSYPITFYQAHIEIPLINAMLTSSIFTALFLTIERLYLLWKPLEKHQLNIEEKRMTAKIYIFLCFLVSTLLHVPNCFERVPECGSSIDDEIRCRVVDNERFDKEILIVYQLIREVICRVVPVSLLAVLNVFIIRNLQQIKHRRRRMVICRAEKKKERNSISYLGSFTEKRLTTMMSAITVIYVLGNVPQSVSTYLNRDHRKLDFSYQIFRAFANTTEIFHHCLNFYVFCLSSRDYLKTFLRHCTSLRRYFMAIFFDGTQSRRESLDTDTSSIKFPGELSVLLNKQVEDLAYL